MHGLIARERKRRTPVDQQVIVRRREVDRARQHGFLVFGFLHRQRAASAEQIRKQARPLPRNVDHDEKGRFAGRR